MPQLSDSQLVVLTAACQRPDQCVFPITARLKGNAAGNVLKSLLDKGLIKEVRAKRDDTVWRHDEERGRMTLVVTKAAFAALGTDRGDEDEDTEADAADPAPTDLEAEPSWQPHTVRGAIAGALKKKLGLDVTSEKDEKRGRVYRIAE